MYEVFLIQLAVLSSNTFFFRHRGLLITSYHSGWIYGECLQKFFVHVSPYYKLQIIAQMFLQRFQRIRMRSGPKYELDNSTVCDLDRALFSDSK
jgi:hypothetical protein